MADLTTHCPVVRAKWSDDFRTAPGSATSQYEDHHEWRIVQSEWRPHHENPSINECTETYAYCVFCMETGSVEEIREAMHV